MAVNTSFYATMNELFKRATNGTISAVVDYASFTDAGQALASMNGADITNQFLAPLMNKVQKTIADNPEYVPELADMYMGSLDYGVLEMIMGHFYEAEQATFDGGTITSGTVYTDQFRVVKPETHVKYYTKSDSWAKTLTRQDTDIRGAFTSPRAMDSFIQSTFTDVANSMKFWRENNRRATLASAMKDAIVANHVEAADENNGAQIYKMVSIYNAKTGSTLTASTCLYDSGFVHFLAATIRDIYKLMAKPSTMFSTNRGFNTFTPKSYIKLNISSILDKAVRTSVINAFNKEYGMFDIDYEVLPYWQNIGDRLRITTNASGETTYSDPIVAVLRDKRSCGEMLQLEDVETDRNGKYKYTNFHWLCNSMYWVNNDANLVMFVLA